jgi:predicted AlkP superfamily pyrophosphatase or phosphodiesterase
MPDRSGDYIVVTKPGWVYGATGTNHGSPHAYDRQVPLILFGAGITRGTYTASASPADIAPTFASLAGISLPSAQGRVLAEALAR